MLNTFSLFSLLPLATAHFTLEWPTSRGFDDAKAVNFACGGFDSVKTPRTSWPLTGAPIQLDMKHTETNLAVYMSVGEDPGTNFNIILVPQFAMNGLGDFCMGMVSVPAGLNISDGTPATIQVVSNGDPDGGLYQCADVVLTSATLSSSDYDSHCKNRTGSQVTQQNIPGNPNETTSEATPSSSTSPSKSAGTAASTGLAAQATAVSWIMGAVGIAGLAML